MTEMTVPLVSRGNGLWGSSSAAWNHLIERESSGRPTVIQEIHDVNSGGNEAEGLFQITPKTWDRHGGRDFAPSARHATPQQQAIVAARIFTRNPTGSDWGAGRPGREDPRDLAAGLVPLDNEGPAMPRPDYQEREMFGRGGSIRSRPPINFFIHTQEGSWDATAKDLAEYCQGQNNVSYHYTVRDGIVYDVVDTDLYSWSVLNANVFSINLCFAGSSVTQTRDQWLQRYGRDIDIAAYLAVQDCRKYNFSTEVLPPRPGQQGSETYAGNPRAGISDHNYVTRELGIGDHVDVGPSFPWDVFSAAVDKYANNKPQEPKVVNIPEDLSDRYLLSECWDQLRGPDGKGWPQLGGRTLVDAVAELLRRTEPKA